MARNYRLGQAPPRGSYRLSAMRSLSALNDSVKAEVAGRKVFSKWQRAMGDSLRADDAVMRATPRNRDKAQKKAATMLARAQAAERAWEAEQAKINGLRDRARTESAKFDRARDTLDQMLEGHNIRTVNRRSASRTKSGSRSA